MPRTFVFSIPWMQIYVFYSQLNVHFSLENQATFKQKSNLYTELLYEICIYLIFHPLPPASEGLLSWFGICGVRRALWFLVSAGRHWRDVSRQDHPLEIWSWSYSSDRWNKGSISILQNTCLLRTSTKMWSSNMVRSKIAIQPFIWLYSKKYEIIA